MSIQPGDAATWAGVVVALIAAAASIVISLIARRDGKQAVIEARRSSDAAEQSASTAREAHKLEQRRHHEERQPQFTARLEWLGSERNIPYAVLEYDKGPDLETVEVRLERAQGFRDAFAAFAHLTTWSLADVKTGNKYDTAVTQPDKFGGRTLLLCHCVAADGQEWPSRTWINVPAVGAGVDLQFEYIGPCRYALRNRGAEAATGVTVHADEDVARVGQLLPEQARIAPGHAHPFHIFDDAAFVLPEALLVSWDGSEGVQSLALPPG